MDIVTHLRCYNRWYVDFEYFQSRVNDIFYIGFQESLDRDFSTLKSQLGIPDECALPQDDISAHRNPVSLDKYIEPHGITALKEWYMEDLEFISICRAIMSNLSTGPHIAAAGLKLCNHGKII